MRKGNLTREQAIEIAGSEAVEKLDSANCDFTNWVQTDGDTAVEFSATVKYAEHDGYNDYLTAYYYQEQDDLDRVEDLSDLDWHIEGYEIH